MEEIKEKYGFIYITANTINGKRYIGQRRYKSKRRWQSYLGSGVALKKAIKKYGKENFIRDIVANAYSKEELDSLEIEFIKKYGAVESNDFYNFAIGGHCRNHPYSGKSKEEVKEIKRKVGIANKGKVNAMLGKHYSLEVRERMSKAQKGGNNPRYGKHLSDETKNKIRETKIGKKNYGARKVICITTKKTFECITDGAKYYNISSATCISKCCKGVIKSAGKSSNGGKLVWVYLEKYLQDENQQLALII